VCLIGTYWRRLECAQECAQTRSEARHPPANANHEANEKRARNREFQARSVILCDLSKPPPSASRPPHHIVLNIVAQGLADFRLSTRIVDFARLSLKLSLSRRRDAWRPREGLPRSRYCIARTRSESCAPSSASPPAPGFRRGRDCEPAVRRKSCRTRPGHPASVQAVRNATRKLLIRWPARWNTH
jgi:hypothetical protein